VGIENINGVGLFVQRFGSGDPLVLAHGSWVDHMSWAFVVPALAQRFQVTAYDRRGHSQSERPATQGSIQEDMADLAAIIEQAGAPAHVVANSMGASISLRLAAERPELLRTLAAHEPPLVGLLRDDPATRALVEDPLELFGSAATDIAEGRGEEAARRFVDFIIGPGAWDAVIPAEVKQMMVNNAPTFLDETRDPEVLTIDTAALAAFDRPVFLSGGSESPPFFSDILDKLHAAIPRAERNTFAGAGHIPHSTHPQDYVAAVTAFIDSAA
jgi:pimeloyl-ACP methyl ester carboxylesterase